MASVLSFGINSDNGVVEEWHERCVEVLEYKSDDVVGRSWLCVMPKEYRREVEDFFEENPEVFEALLPLQSASGQRCVAKFSIRKSGPRSARFFCLGRTPLGSEGPLGLGVRICDLQSAWPVRIAPVPDCGKGLIAERDFETGQVILEEEPFFTRLQPAAMQDRPEWDTAWSDAFSQIRTSLQFPPECFAETSTLLASAALVRNCLGFAQSPAPLRGALGNLSHPPLDSNHALVEIALKVAELCKRRLPECQKVSAKLLQAGILTIETNCFPGGRIFWTISHANHSCAPNALFVSTAGKWCLKALRPIRIGEEVCISYLSEELLYPAEVRRRLLWRSKCFLCRCARCSAVADPLRDRPCIRCIPRTTCRCWVVVHTPGAWCRGEPSTEGAKKDFKKTGEVVSTTGSLTTTAEGQWVQAAPPATWWMLVDGAALGLGPLIEPASLEELRNTSESDATTSPMQCPMPDGLFSRFLDRMAQTKMANYTNHLREWYQRQKLQHLALPSYILEAPAEEVTYAQFEATDSGRKGRWRCAKCGWEEPAGAALLEAERELASVVQHIFATSLADYARVDGNLRLVPDNVIGSALIFADDLAAVFGRRHWAYQTALCFVVDLDLSLQRYACNAQAWMSEEHVGGLLQHLLEMWDWLGLLGLAQEPAMFLHSRATAGLRVAEDMLMLGKRRSGGTAAVLAQALQRRLDDASTAHELRPQRCFIPGSLMVAS